MIILNGDEEHVKTDSFPVSTIRLPERARSTHSSLSLLPDYNASEEQQRLLKHPQKNSRFDPKIWRAALYALGIYVILSVAIGGPLVVLKSKGRESNWAPGPTSALWGVDDVNPPTPFQLMRTGLSVGEDVTCNAWDTAENKSSGLLLSTWRSNLPAHGLITVRSNVSYDANDSDGISGSLVVDVNNDSKASGVVFYVDLRSSSPQLRQRTNACFSSNGANRGLSIYVPSNLTYTDQLIFDIRVLLPQGSNSIDSLVTYLPMFSQSYGDLQNQVWLGQISIEGTSQLISCRSLGASQISVKNILAPIQGRFNVTTSLSLDTVKGAIEANITLVQRPSCLRPTLLSLDTGYSPINADVSLVGPPSKSSLPSPSPTFAVHVRTFNGPINLHISHDAATPPSSVQLQVQNNLAESNIGIDPKFQGTFRLQTKLAQATVLEAVDTLNDDPTGGNRTRDVVYNVKTPGKVSGWVGWGLRPNSLQKLSLQGYIEIVSSLSPVTLDLGLPQ